MKVVKLIALCAFAAAAFGLSACHNKYDCCPAHTPVPVAKKYTK